MSSSSEIVDSGRNSGQNMSLRPPERSSFSKTCNLFSQYLKENSTFPDLTLGRFLISSKSKLNLSVNVVDEFLKYVKFEFFMILMCSGRRAATMSLFPVTETARATVHTQAQKQQDQSRTMTIFYNGQVIVFNDLAPEKVEEIMKVAEQGVAQKHPKPDEPSNRTVVANSDLPIARKASLARFLEKRKDRITARSPYQVHDVSKQEDNKEWLGLAARSH
ncbi:hypothetical protein R6Q57_028544 [Mikania cordata]